jgi:hypothetical protein
MADSQSKMDIALIADCIDIRSLPLFMGLDHFWGLQKRA